MRRKIQRQPLIYLLLLSLLTICMIARLIGHTKHDLFLINEAEHFAVVGVFVTASTSIDRMLAIARNVNSFNSYSSKKIKLVFFVGRSGHPRAPKFPDLELLVGNFNENMNEGKSFEWLKAAAHRYNAVYIIKSDTDVAVNWQKLVNFLSSATSPNVYLGSLQTFELCGRNSYCPPPGCKDMKGGCWVYMSGGFYGVSRELARTILACDYARFHHKGHEDLTTGKIVKNCKPETSLVVIPNGQAWCHSKSINNKNIELGVLPEQCNAVEFDPATRSLE